MKKFSSVSRLILLGSVAVLLFAACQKEQTPSIADDQAVPASEGAVKGIAGTGRYSGSINQSYADALASNYIRKYGDDDRATQSVAFSANDLISFLTGLKAKYKSDVIYVNFGVYGKGALPVNGKDWGRLTVFFTGNNIPSSSSSGRKTDGVDDASAEDEFLNHGQMIP